MRVDETEIPAGTLTAVTLYLQRAAIPESANAGEINFYRIKPANDWVEGVKNGSVANVGESNWSWAKHTVQAWAGSAGCGTSCTDYYADGSPPTLSYSAYTSGATYYESVVLPTAWFEAFRDTPDENEGFLGRNDYSVLPVSKDLFVAYGAEVSPGGPYLTIEYTLPAGGLTKKTVGYSVSPASLTAIDPRGF
jgi:hypothetical protein